MHVFLLILNVYLYDMHFYLQFFFLSRPFKPLFMDARILSLSWRRDFVVQNIDKLCRSSARISWCSSFFLFNDHTTLQRAKTKSVLCYWLSKGKLAYWNIRELVLTILWMIALENLNLWEVRFYLKLPAFDYFQ